MVDGPPSRKRTPSPKHTYNSEGITDTWPTYRCSNNFKGILKDFKDKRNIVLPHKPLQILAVNLSTLPMRRALAQCIRGALKPTTRGNECMVYTDFYTKTKQMKCLTLFSDYCNLSRILIAIKHY